MKKISIISVLAAAALILLPLACGDKEETIGNESDVQDTVATRDNSIPGWVDLGLPSGLLWAECNLGASSPKEFGNYYAWAEVEPKNNYSGSTYRYFNTENGNKITKYCTVSSFGHNNYTDSLTTLQAMDDAVVSAYGAGTRTPTKREWSELITNTTAVWTTQDLEYGLLVTAANGNSIFLPAAGHYYGSERYEARNFGSYWSATLDDGNPDMAWICLFGSRGGMNTINTEYRAHGLSVRAVRQI